MPNATQVSTWGNILAVSSPEAIVREARLAEGARLSLDLQGDGRIVLRSRQTKYSLAKLVAGIRRGNRHRETDWGASQGKESWGSKLSQIRSPPSGTKAGIYQVGHEGA